MTYDPTKHHRRSIRLKGYDYSQAGLYFITLCCNNRACLFGTIKNGQMILNPFGRIIDEEWNKSLEIRNNIALHEYIIMPNHFHAILEIIFPHPGADESKLDGRGSGESIFANKGEGEIIRGEYQFATTGFKSPSHTIGAIIRGFKGITTKRIKELYLGGEFNWGEYRFATTGSDNSERGEFPFAPTIPDKIWQRNYYEHIIRTEKAYINISQYIINNPANWKKDSLK